eukprot:13442480-Alexandrium_andersonii.AAC.1
MSASLVGSEMCIRDRAQEGLSRTVKERSCQLKDGGRLARSKRGARAVSYTHLTLPTICSV